MSMERQALMEFDSVSKRYIVRKDGRKQLLQAVTDITLKINHGEILGLVGESGSGKSTVAKLMLRLEHPTEGSVRFEGGDLKSIKGAELAHYRAAVQCVFQNPYTSLSPRRKIVSTISEPMEQLDLSDAEKRTKVEEACRAVGLASSVLNRYPHELSGGQRQRVAIARAIVTRPSFLVLDEPVSALDVSIRAQVVNLLSDIKEELGSTYLFIAHDLSVVRHLCRRIAVIYLGKLAETGSREDIYGNPLHPYTQALLNSIIEVGPEARKQDFPELGDLPSPVDPPSGCRFHTRCPFVMPECRTVTPELREVESDHWVACHLY